MYSLTLKSGIFRLTFSGTVDLAEMTRWAAESREMLKTAPKTFSIIVDMRDLAVLADPVKVVLQNGQAEYKAHGLQRAAVVVKSALIRMQFERIAKASGVLSIERYISSEETPNWEKAALDWAANAVEPA